MRVAINGFGRIGRLVFKKLIEKDGIDVVAINDLSPLDSLAHLLKYDSSQGSYDGDIEVKNNTLHIEDSEVLGFSEKEPSALPWSDLNIDVVIESTGVFRTKELMQKHLDAGAKKVLLSAPAKSDGVETIVLGVNDQDIDEDKDFYSNASCTTNCLAPLVKVINEKWGLSYGMMNTTHAYTASQNIQDAPHKDWRRARAAAVNLIPTTTGAAKATEIVYPEIKGKIDAMAIRVPVITGSMTELTFLLDSENVTTEDINKEFIRASQEEFEGIIAYNEDEIVSTDIIGNPHSAVYDAPLIKQSGPMFKIIAWYDNESGYSSRLADLTEKIASFH